MVYPPVEKDQTCTDFISDMISYKICVSVRRIYWEVNKNRTGEHPPGTFINSFAAIQHATITTIRNEIR